MTKVIVFLDILGSDIEVRLPSPPGPIALDYRVLVPVGGEWHGLGYDVLKALAKSNGRQELDLPDMAPLEE